jgi:Ala-tRNA(Pro) deacylase
MVDPYEAIVRLLDASHIKYEKIEHEPVFTSEQAAAVRGLILNQGAKSLLFKVKGEGFVLVVMPGDRRVDSKRLKKFLKAKDVRFASPEEVKGQMGCEVGSCYPFGNVAGLRTLADETLSRSEIISFNPGRHDISIKLKYADYEKLARPEVIEVT